MANSTQTNLKNNVPKQHSIYNMLYDHNNGLILKTYRDHVMIPLSTTRPESFRIVCESEKHHHPQDDYGMIQPMLSEALGDAHEQPRSSWLYNFVRPQCANAQMQVLANILVNWSDVDDMQEFLDEKYNCFMKTNGGKCDIVCKDPERLLRHLRNSHGGTHYECDEEKICHCGVRNNTLKAHIKHHISAHLKNKYSLQRLLQSMRGPLGQAYQPCKMHHARRQFFMKHVLRAQNLEIFKQLIPIKHQVEGDDGPLRVRMFIKEPRRGKELNVSFKFKDSRTYTLLFNSLENNECILRNLGVTMEDKDFKFFASGQISFALLGYNVGELDVMKDIDTILDKGLTFLAMLCFLKALWDSNNSTRILLLTYLAMAALRNKDCRKEFMKHSRTVLDYCAPKIGSRPTGHAFDGFPAGSIIAVLMLLMFSAAPNESTLNMLSKSFAKCGNATKGVMNTMDGVNRFLEWFTEKGSSTVFGFPLQEKSVIEIKELIEHQVNVVVNLIERETDERNHPDYVSEVKKSYHAIVALQARFSGKFVPQGAMMKLNVMALKMTKLYDRVINSGVTGMGGRVEPVVFCFNGASGIGKSHVAMQFAVKAIKFLDKENKLPWPSQIFVRDAGNKYWDNYKEQLVVLYDDFGQLVDSVAAPNPEFLELIRSQNIMDWPLTMASLEDKANTYFKSKMIILTTNMENISARSLTCNDALRRRIEYNFTVIPKASLADYNQGLSNMTVPPGHTNEEISRIRPPCGPYRVTKDPHPNDYVYRIHKNGITKDYEANEVLEIMQADLMTKETRFKELLEKYSRMDASASFSPVAAVDDTTTFEPQLETTIANEIGTTVIGAQQPLSQDTPDFQRDPTIQPPPRYNIDLDRAHMSIAEMKRATRNGHGWLNSYFNGITALLNPTGTVLNFWKFKTAQVDLNDTYVLCTQTEATHGGQIDPNGPHYLASEDLSSTRTIKAFKRRKIEDEYASFNLLPEMEKAAAIAAFRPFGRNRIDFYCRPMKGNEKMGMMEWIGMVSTAYVIGKALIFMYSHFFGEREGNDDMLTHRHEGLAIGSKVEHAHACESCQTQFKHTHTIKHPTISMKYGPHLCKNCKASYDQLLEAYQFNGITLREHPEATKDKEQYGKNVALAMSQLPPQVQKIDEEPFVFNRSSLTIEPRQDLVIKGSVDDVIAEEQRYDSGSTRKPPIRKVQGPERYDGGNTTKPPIRKIQTGVLESMNSEFPLPQKIWDIAKRMANGEDDFSTPLWHQFSIENQTKIADILGTAHIERLDFHRKMVYDAWDKHAIHFPTLSHRRMVLHDQSKFEIMEVIGYTLKWHDSTGEIWQKFLDNGFKQEDKEKIWNSALQHHYKHNEHHPEHNDDRNNQINIEEGVCDMVGVACEKAGIEIPEDFSKYADLVLAEEGKYVKRFNDIERAYIDSLLLGTGEVIMDQNARELTLSIDKNQYMMFVSDDKGEGAIWQRLLNCFFIKGRLALFNRHGVAAVKASKYLQLRNARGKIYTLEVKNLGLHIFRTARSDDIAFMECPREVGLHMDLSKHFIRADNLSKVASTPASLLTLDMEQPSTIRSVRHATMATLQTSRRYMVTCPVTGQSGTFGEPSSFNQGSCFIYRAQTAAGDCGSVLVATNKQVPNKILGFHVWGFIDSQSGSYVLTWEELNECISNIPLRAQSSGVAPQPYGEFNSDQWQDTNYQLMGILSPVPSSQKTQLRRTELDYKEPMTEPTMLKPTKIDGVRIDPMELQVPKYSRNLPCLDQDIVDEAASEFEAVLMSGENREHFRKYGVLSTEAGVAGIPEEEYMPPMDRSTSPGYPYVRKQRKQRGKQYWIDENHNINAELKNDIEQRKKDLKEGKLTGTLWIDSLKDERRPPQKVRKGKTRVFCCGPMDYTAVFRCFFLAFAAYVMYNRVGNEVSVGINPIKEWPMLEKKLTTFGEDNLVAGDFSSFDATLHSAIMWKILDIINRFYDDGHDYERELLFIDVVNSTHLSKGQTYQLSHGNPSGQPITSILNSMYNSIATRVAYKLKARKEAGPFKDNVTMNSFGDDSGINVDPVCEMTQNKWTEGYAEIGMTYTREDKSENDGTEYRNISDITYLKRGFVKIANFQHTVAPLDLDVILEIPLWVKTEVSVEEETINNIETAFEELALHGQKVYDKWTRIIYDNARTKLTKLPELVSWHLMMEKVTGIKPSMGLQAITAREEQQSLNEGSALVALVEGGQLPIGHCAPPENKANVSVSGDERLIRRHQGYNYRIASTTSIIPGIVSDTEPQTDQSLEQTEQEIVQFRADLPVEDSGYKVTRLNDNAPFSDNMRHDLTDILSRPYLISDENSVWKATDTVDTQIGTFVPIRALLNQPNFKDKIGKFRYGTFNVRMRFMANFTAVQTGKILIKAFPAGKHQLYYGNGMSETFQMSTFYGGEIDAGTQEEIELTLPFYNDIACYVLNKNPAAWDLGWRVIVKVLNPLQGVDNNEMVDLNVYAWIEQVELDMPTGQISSKFPSGEGKTTMQHSYDNRTKRIWTFTEWPDELPKAEALSDAGFFVNGDKETQCFSCGGVICDWDKDDLPMAVHYREFPHCEFIQDINMTGQGGATEGEKKAGGVISTTLNTVADIAGALSVVPMLSEIAGPVGWVASAAAGAAQFFGFSKPFNEKGVERMVITPGCGMNHVDGLDTSFKCSAMTNTQVEQLDEEDEMAIAPIAKKQGIVGRHTWKFSDAKGMILYSAFVSPFMPCMFKKGGDNPNVPNYNGIFYTLSPLTWLSTLFCMWNGDVSFRISLAKNDFYTGKLLLSFHPFTSTEQTGTDDDVYHRIVSVREQHDFVVTIPYVYFKQWAKKDEAIGMMQVQVFNRLQAAGIVSDTVYFNVWHFSNNMQFSIPETHLPRGTISVRGLGDPEYMTHHRLATERKAVLDSYQQMIKQQKLMDDNDKTMIGQITQSTNSTENGNPDYLFGSPRDTSVDKCTVGERIVNLRPLTRRFNLKSMAQKGSLKFHSSNFCISDMDANFPLSTGSVTIQEYMSAVFRFMRGGIRVKMYSPNAVQDQLGFVQQAGWGVTLFGEGIDAPFNRDVNTGVQAHILPTVNGCIEAEIPFYADRQKWWTTKGCYFNQDDEPHHAELEGATFNIGWLSKKGDASTGADFELNDDTLHPTYWAAADDHTFSMFMGTPIIYGGVASS